MSPLTFRRIAIATAALLAIAGFVGALRKVPQAPAANRLAITASFYPVAEFARAVGGTHITVRTLVPYGIEPHDYEPSPTDMAAVAGSSAFFYNGAGFEPWATHIAKAAGSSGTAIVDTGSAIPIASVGQGSGATPDPHYWIDPVFAATQAATIRDALIAVDPDHAETYRTNARALIDRLSALDAAYRLTLASCAKRDIVTSHDAFGYLARRYGFTAHAIAGISPEDEPSPSKIAQLSTLIRTLDIGYVFFETLASPKIAHTIAAETGAVPLVFNPIEGVTMEEERAGKEYFSLSRDNLVQLSRALGCRQP